VDLYVVVFFVIYIIVFNCTALLAILF